MSARLAVFLFALGLAGQSADAAPIHMGPGSPVPQVARSDLSGKPFDSGAYRGKVMLIDFWASWCAPCIVEMPHLIALQKRFGPRGLQVVGISMDDSAAAAKTVKARFAFNYPVLLGDAKLGRRFGGILGLPVEMLVGRDGKIIKIWTADIPSGKIERAIQAATG